MERASFVARRLTTKRNYQRTREKMEKCATLHERRPSLLGRNCQGLDLQCLMFGVGCSMLGRMSRADSPQSAMQLTADFFQQTSTIRTVSELTRSIRGTLETKFRAVWVQGEISNYKLHPSGHQYFTLKDSRAQIACVIFRNAPLSIRQPLADGAQVQVYGNVSVFEARGQYQ